MIDGIPLNDLAPPTLLGICILLILFGRLIPWWFYKSKAEECEKWRLAYEAERTARIASESQTTELLEFAKTTHAIVVAAFGNVEYHRQSGEGHVVPTSTKK